MMGAKQKNEQKKKRDPDLVNAEIAIQRAVRGVRELSEKTGAPIVVLKGGKIVKEVPGTKSHAGC